VLSIEGCDHRLISIDSPLRLPIHAPQLVRNEFERTQVLSMPWKRKNRLEMNERVLIKALNLMFLTRASRSFCRKCPLNQPRRGDLLPEESQATQVG